MASDIQEAFAGNVDIPRLLSSIDQHLQLLVKLQPKPVFQKEVSTPELKALYKAIGTASRENLAKQFGISTGKVSMLWQGWEQAGLLRKVGQQYERTM